MLLQFTFLILSKYDLPIRWALSRFESGISKFYSAQISFTFSSTLLEVSLFTDDTSSILKQSLRLYCSVSSQEATMALFCFFNLLICSWRKLLSWQSWWILPSSLLLILLISSFKISLNFSPISFLNFALSSSYLLSGPYKSGGWGADPLPKIFAKFYLDVILAVSSK